MNTIPAFFLTIITCVSVFLSPLRGHAENHALLIGIGNYPYLPQGSSLPGPAHDVAALRWCLVENLGFKESNITVLQDSDAVKSTILRQIVALKQKSRFGDLVLIYFSGHGTSARDTTNNWKMPLQTGAIIPADYHHQGPLEQRMEQLIIGKTDLQQLLKNEGLEDGRRIVMIFDSCFSGQAVRSPLIKKRNIRSIGNFDTETPLSEKSRQMIWQESAAAVYPYRNVVYLSAAGPAEPAVDIDQSAREKGQTTIDNKDHGAFTNILLHAFNYQNQGSSVLQERSPADENGDGRLTAGELHQYIRGELRRRNFSQSPSLLTPKNGRKNELTGGRAWNDVPLFTFTKKASPQAAVPKEPHNIRIAQLSLPSHIRKELQSVPGIELLPAERKKEAELLVNEEQDGFALYHSSSKLLVKLPDTAALKQRLARQPLLKRLEFLAQLPKKYGVMAEIIGSSGVYLTGMDMGVELRLERESRLLLLDIAPSGKVKIIWPCDNAELKKINGISYPGLATLTDKDTGTEVLVALAYQGEPIFWNKVLTQTKEDVDNAFLEEVIQSTYSDVFAGASVDYALIVGKNDLVER